MLIGGISKTSLIDYPGKLSTILFTRGCNFRCPWCHNPELVNPEQFQPPILQESIMEFLHKRRNQLDAVVITGGEPLLHEDIVPFVEEIKQLGYLVKIDTNGSFPDVLRTLYEQSLVDYCAMDLKAPPEKYPSLAGVVLDIALIRESVDIIKHHDTEHEFRITVVDSLLNGEDIYSMKDLFTGAQRLVLQRFIPSKTLDPALQAEPPTSKEKLESLQKEVAGCVRECIVR